MMKWLLFSTVLLLSACSSTLSPTYYQLPVSDVSLVQSVQNGQKENTKPLLWVENVTVADYLAGNGVVYQTDDVRYVIAARHLWASPLDQQLHQTLVSFLSADLPDWLVFASAPNQSHDSLQVTITGFHGSYNGNVIISGEWTLNHQGTLLKRAFRSEVPQPADGYDVLVRTLAASWQQQIQHIANDIVSVSQN